MLEGNYQQSLGTLLDRLQCGVELPEAWQDFHDKRGIVPSQSEERRRFARSYYRDRAVLETRPTLPAIERRHQFFCVYTKDISRCGISFLHMQQMFPCEQLMLWTRAGKLQCSVVRCLRHNSRCYEIGTVFET